MKRKREVGRTGTKHKVHSTRLKDIKEWRVKEEPGTEQQRESGAKWKRKKLKRH